MGCGYTDVRRLQVTLSEDTWLLLADVARVQGVSKSGLVEQALVKMLGTWVLSSREKQDGRYDPVRLADWHVDHVMNWAPIWVNYDGEAVIPSLRDELARRAEERESEAAE